MVQTKKIGIFAFRGVNANDVAIFTLLKLAFSPLITIFAAK
jgi:hypothetical protein